MVGLSKLRSKSFSGLKLEDRLAALGTESQCGLAVIDLNTGHVVHTLTISAVVEELFDVVVLPGVRQPRALGFQDDDIDRLVNFPGSKGLMVTKPTVHRPGLSAEVQVAGLPRLSQLADDAPAAPAGRKPGVVVAPVTMGVMASAPELTVEAAMTGGQGLPVPAPDLGPQARQTFELDKPLRDARDEFEKCYFEFHLAREGGSMTRVAEKTGLERTHLYRKLKQLGVDLSRAKRSAG